jgi:hypothetical protein
LDSSNYHTFGAWEFDNRCRVGYLGHIAYLRNKYGGCLDDSDEEDVNGDDDTRMISRSPTKFYNRPS